MGGRRCAAARERPGLLTAASLAAVTGRRGRRRCSRSTARRSPIPSAARRCGATWPPGCARDYGGEAAALLAAAGGRLGGAGGLLDRLARVRGLRRPAGEEGAAVREDLRAPRLARGRRPRELGGLGRQRADAPRAALGPGRAGRPRRGARRDAGGVQAGRRAHAGSRRRCSTTCSGSSAATTPTCSAPRPATCASRRATRARPGTDAQRIERGGGVGEEEEPDAERRRTRRASETNIIGSSGPRSRRRQPPSSSSASTRAKTPVTRR